MDVSANPQAVQQIFNNPGRGPGPANAPQPQQQVPPQTVGQMVSASKEFHQGLEGVGGLMPMPSDISELQADDFQLSSDFDRLSNLLDERPDLDLSEILGRDRQGKLTVDPALFDDSVQQILKSGDFTPEQVMDMKKQFTQLLTPALADRAMTMAVELLGQRPDLTPDALIGMLSEAKKAAGDGKNPQEGASALSMFENASKLLMTRTDVAAGDVSGLIRQIGQMGKKTDDQDGGVGVAKAFESATTAMMENDKLNVSDMKKLADTISNRFPGQNDEAADMRLNAFSQGAKMLAKNPKMRVEHLDQMLNQAGQKGLEGGGLLQAMMGMGAGLADGSATMQDLMQGKIRFRADGQRMLEPLPGTENRGQQGRGGQAPAGQQQTRPGANQASNRPQSSTPRSGGSGPRR